MIKQIRISNTGFTLLEVLIASSLAIALVLGGSTLLLRAQRASASVARNAETQFARSHIIQVIADFNAKRYNPTQGQLDPLNLPVGTNDQAACNTLEIIRRSFDTVAKVDRYTLTVIDTQCFPDSDSAGMVPGGCAAGNMGRIRFRNYAVGTTSPTSWALPANGLTTTVTYPTGGIRYASYGICFHPVPNTTTPGDYLAYSMGFWTRGQQNQPPFVFGLDVTLPLAGRNPSMERE